MRRAVLLLSAAVALSWVVSGQTPVLTPGVAAKGSIDPQTGSVFGFYANPGDAVLIRLLTLSQDYSLGFKVHNGASYSQPINPRVYSVPNPTPGYPPSSTPGPGGIGVTFGGEYDLPGNGQGYYTITVSSQNQVAGDFLLIYTSLTGRCPSSNPSCVVPLLLNCGVPAVNQQIGLPPPPPANPPQPASPWLQLNSYQFQANPGDMLSVRVAKYASQTMPLASGFNLGVLAYDSSGKILYLNTATSQFAAVETSSGVATKLDMPAPADGFVNIVVFDVSNQTGNYGISVSTLNRPCSNKSLTCGSASQGKLASPLAIDSYKASVSSGATISIRAASTDAGSSLVPVVEVYDPTGSPVASAQSLTTATFKTTAQGDYTVLVESANFLQTGGYSVAFARLDVPCNAGGSPPQALSCASVVDGSINGALQTNSYSVAAQANDAFLIRLEQTSPNSAFRPRVDVYDPRGNPITFTNTNLQVLPFTATADGSYTLSVSDSSAGGSQTGTYSLSLLRLNRPCNAGTIGCGALATGNFSRPLASSVYTYTAAAGESFSLRMLDYTGALQPDLEVYDSLGNSVGQGASGNVAGVDVVQPAAGVYTVVAMDASVRQAGGPFGIELLRTRNACSAASQQGQTVNGVINGAQPFISYSIPATNGDSLMVRSASITPGFAAQMDLYDPTGVHLDSSTFALPSRKVSATGTYTVIVGASAPLSTGGYALSWQLLNKPAATSALQCGGSTTASLSAANEFRYYLAGANAGDLMRLVFTKISANFSPQIELFDPTGAKLTGASDISQKVASGGAYLVVVSPSTAASETGSFTVAFQRPNNPCSPTTLACGQPTLRQVAIPGQLDTFVFAATRGGQADIKLVPRSGSYSPYAELYDASGNRLTTASNGQLTAVIYTTGTYSLLVRDLGGNLGSYRASFQDDYNPCTISDTEPPVVTLLKPTAGEVIAGNTTYRIQWQSDDNVGIASHDIALSTDGGQTFATAIAGGLAGNTQTFNWFVPPDIAPTRTAVIRVTATDGAGNAQSASSGLLSLIGSGFTANSTATFTYDSLNRLTQAVLGDGRTIAYTWDAAGNLVQITVSGQ